MAKDTDTTVSAGLAVGGTASVELETNHAERTNVLVDDNAGGTPASYDLSVEVDIDGTGTYIAREELAGSTAINHNHDSLGATMRYTITNASAAAADYRLHAEAR